MGLDMYLHKKVYRYLKKDGTYSNDINDCKFDDYGRSNGVYISTTVGYWRKSNQIHEWFVDNVQNGNDDCGEYHVDFEQLKELRDLCMTLLKTLDGQTITVPKKDIEEYKKTCKQVTKLPTKDVKFSVKNLKKVSLCGFHVLTAKQAQPFKDSLPCTDGFFFGSTKYNGWYIMDIIKTYLMLDEVIKVYEKEKKGKKFADFYYQASW